MEETVTISLESYNELRDDLKVKNEILKMKYSIDSKELVVFDRYACTYFINKRDGFLVRKMNKIKHLDDLNNKLKRRIKELEKPWYKRLFKQA